MVYAASCFSAQQLRVAKRIKKQLVDYTSVKEKIPQSWRYKTLRVQPGRGLRELKPLP